MAKLKIQKFKKKEIPKLTYGIIHSQFGMQDGVSIVMQQVEDVLIDNLGVPKENIKYLVGKSGIKGAHITEKPIIWHKHPLAKTMNTLYQKGFSEKQTAKFEKAIKQAKNVIGKWIEKESPNVIIAHNTCHPVNFITSLGLARYYDEKIKEGKKTPKYMLWWHDSFLERDRYQNPEQDVEQYLVEGMPGHNVEYIMFINSLQFKTAQQYFRKLETKRDDFSHLIHQNHDVIYNTTSTFIDTFEDLYNSKNAETVEHFLEQFRVIEFLHEKQTTFDKTLFCLQHTRVVPRKRIDFALEYTFSLLYTLRKRKKYDSMYFLISGYSGDETNKYRPKLERLHKQLCKKYGIENHFLIFAEDYDKHSIPFEEYPRIFAKLGGISTYFSEIEGFGNNLLEVLASGLIPIVYTYPVFKQDIAKYKFKCIPLDDFIVDADSIILTADIVENHRKRKIWVNRNLDILRKNFDHEIIASKLTRGIIRRRTHI